MPSLDRLQAALFKLSQEFPETAGRAAKEMLVSLQRDFTAFLAKTKGKSSTVVEFPSLFERIHLFSLM